jgi:hypothetical protein
VRSRGLAVLLAAVAGNAAAAGWPGPAMPVRFAPEHDQGPFVVERADGLPVEMLRLVQGQAGPGLWKRQVGAR